MNTQRLPLIGLTVYSADDKYHYFPHDYVKSVRLSGGIPVLLPPGESRNTDLIRALDGVILTGGGDINPQRYSGEGHPQLYWVNDGQDESEFNIASTALEMKLPVFATCRGLQIINTLMGGSLHPHFPDHYGDDISHRSEANQAVEHLVTLESDSALARLVDEVRFTVKSWHHQSIKDLANGFRAVGFAEDGVIEAIESEDYPDLVAVQWHPEIDNENNGVQQKLFQRWIAKCLSGDG